MTTPDTGLMPSTLTNGHDPVRVLTADDMLMGGIAIDAWLKVSRFGMTIGDDTTMFVTRRDRLADTAKDLATAGRGIGQTPTKHGF